ncbi:hypothetical protein HOE22_06670 [Candidatus Woesearchaeota archaeon]|jgi:hypothetical protein|nr:hypothetical protein [Candidatus Woesearchaeota archaeon]MBT7555569.1 hypothetical protein [Candidatus Woesearchaeota archaeon]|tara:strand:+ start:67 stop:246 length:180 start_codon:yes stop_codon:yes gene_type:complete
MPKKTTKTKTRKSLTTTVKRTKDGNIIGNFRGKEDQFWTRVSRGFKKLLSPAFPKKRGK